MTPGLFLMGCALILVAPHIRKPVAGVLAFVCIMLAATCTAVSAIVAALG